MPTVNVYAHPMVIYVIIGTLIFVGIKALIEIIP